MQPLADRANKATSRAVASHVRPRCATASQTARIHVYYLIKMLLLLDVQGVGDNSTSLPKEAQVSLSLTLRFAAQTSVRNQANEHILADVSSSDLYPSHLPSPFPRSFTFIPFLFFFYFLYSVLSFFFTEKRKLDAVPFLAVCLVAL